MIRKNPSYLRKNSHHITMKHILSILLFLFPFIIFAQVKIEKEKRVGVSEVPQKAISFIEDLFPEVDKTKWYQETNENGESYEAKLKWEKRYYSVKFTENGRIEDIEFVFPWDEIEEPIQNAINLELTSQFKKYKLGKIQIQLIGDEEYLKRLIQENEINTIKGNYEIVVQAKKDKEMKPWELLFDKDGKLLKIRPIKENTTYNLDF